MGDLREGRKGGRWVDRTGDRSEAQTEGRKGGHSEDPKEDRTEGHWGDHWVDRTEDQREGRTGGHWEGLKAVHLAVLKVARQAVGWAARASAGSTAGQRRVRFRSPAA